MRLVETGVSYIGNLDHFFEFGYCGGDRRRGPGQIVEIYGPESRVRPLWRSTSSPKLKGRRRRSLHRCGSMRWTQTPPENWACKSITFDFATDSGEQALEIAEALVR